MTDGVAKCRGKPGRIHHQPCSRN